MYCDGDEDIVSSECDDILSGWVIGFGIVLPIIVCVGCCVAGAIILMQQNRTRRGRVLLTTTAAAQPTYVVPTAGSGYSKMGAPGAAVVGAYQAPPYGQPYGQPYAQPYPQAGGSYGYPNTSS